MIDADLRTDAESPILYGTAARAALLRGADQMAGLIVPTLGPVPRTVAVAPILGNSPPEILDTAATIAKRTIELADPFENPGAMLIRDLVLRVADETGDGGATTTVLVQALLHDGGRLLAGGVNVIRLVRGLRRGLEIALTALDAQTVKIDHPDEIARVARHGVVDQRLAETIGEILDTVGADGIVLVEDAHGTETTHQYVDGVRWESGYLSSHLLPAGEATARVIEPRILLTDIPVERPEQIVPALEACVAADAPRLVVIAPEVRDQVIATLLTNRERGVLAAALAIGAPSIGYQRTGILGDLAAMTGGRFVQAETGGRLERVTAADLGSARQVWASRQAFGVVGGRGAREAVRKRLVEVRAELKAGEDDRYTRNTIRERIAKLTGTGAMIRVGAPTQGSREILKQQIEATLTSTRLAMETGVVAGGGGALLACVEAVEQHAARDDEGAGLALLARALAAPAMTIARNAGYDGRAIVYQRRSQEAGSAFDVLRGAWVDAHASGLVDSVGVTRTALEAAVSAAATVLTVDVLIRRRDPLRRIRGSWKGG